MDIFTENNFYQGTSQACLVDLTPPTFSGLSSLDVESRGQIRATWSAGTDVSNPIRYEVYIQPTTATGLFSTSNIVALTPNLQFDIYTLPDGSFLTNGVTYFVGIRAVDAVGNRDGNTVSNSVVSTGILTSIDTYEVEASYSRQDSGNIHITLWANKNGNLATGSILGAASYEVYDSDGALVSGLSETGIAADASGLFIATPVVYNLVPDHHFDIKATIVVDGEARTNIITITKEAEVLDIDGVSYVDSSGDLVGSFWVSKNANVIASNLGTASYQAYRADGTIISGLTESGITADVNGFFAITPFSLPGTVSTYEAYVVKVTIEVEGVSRSKNIIIQEDAVVYDCKAVFSINASNELEGTFWATENDQVVSGLSLGTASYQIYNKAGVAVSGLTQSGITADSNGMYHSTGVSASLLTDLTHYTAKVTISVAGKNRVAIKGFTLLGT